MYLFEFKTMSRPVNVWICIVIIPSRKHSKTVCDRVTLKKKKKKKKKKILCWADLGHKMWVIRRRTQPGQYLQN